MAKDSFIDGLQPRSEKIKEQGISNIQKSQFASGYKSIEFGDKNISRTSRREINKIVEETKLTPKPQKKTKETPKHSYARDILGIEDEEINLDTEDLKREKKARKLEKKKNKKNKRKKKFIFRHKILCFFIIPLFILLSVAYVWGDSLMLKITNGRSGLFDFIRTVVTGNAELKTGSDGRTNILIFGTSGYDMEGSEGDGSHDGAQLTDSIMVLSIDQNTKDVAMISLPRDLKTDTCMASGKINELYYCENKKGDDEIKGANALRSRVSDILGIDIQYYAHINWMSLIQIVDSIGGITVTTDEDINDDWTKTYVKAGQPVYLNGEKALGLARARHGTENGDFTRSASQQKILIAIKEKIASANFGITDLINLANILGENLRSDFDADTIYAGAKLFSSTNFESIRQISLTDKDSRYLTTGYINGISYVYPTAGQKNYTSIRKYIKESLLKNPVILENAQILILNGSGVAGLAEKERDALHESIFNVKATGDAPSGNYFEQIYLYATTNKPATKERLETYYNTKALDGEFMPRGINSDGIDFVIILGVGYSVD